VVKAAERLAHGQGAAEAKAAALHPNGTRAHYLTIYRRDGRGGEKKRRQSDLPVNQIDRKVIDRRTHRQAEKRADGLWYLGRLCNVLNSGLRTPRRWLKPICDNAETLAGAGTDVWRCSDRLGPHKYLHLYVIRSIDPYLCFWTATSQPTKMPGHCVTIPSSASSDMVPLAWLKFATAD
jgi:hypothetical protein